MASPYVRAAGRVGSTRMYDRSIAVTMCEEHWRPLLRDRVLRGVPDGGHVVDVGAGTGTLAIAIARARPDVTVTAIDGDPEILALACGGRRSSCCRCSTGSTAPATTPQAAFPASCAPPASKTSRYSAQPPSAVAARAQALDDRADAAPSVGAVGDGVWRLPAGGGPRCKHVEVELGDQLEAADIRRAVA
jgi:hypothetical protein